MPILRLCATLILALAASLGRLCAQEQPPIQEPQLRIEAGMHTANIRRIDMSADGKLLATGSDDKTVRLWSLPGGKLIRTFRVPIGPGNDGKIYAVAISPDGRLIAAGGWDAYWSGSPRPVEMHVYLFDTVSGALLRKLGPLSGGIFDLTFSADGGRLAVGLSGNNGIRVWTRPFIGEPKSDTAYGDVAFGIDFDPAGSGRLATISDDGLIRLYERDFALPPRTAKMPRDERPNAIDFSPDGKQLAVAYVRTTKIDLISVPELARVHEVDTAFADNGALGSVAWSANGQSLYGGGRFFKQGIIPVIRWADAGRGKSELFGRAQSTIFDLATPPEGGVVAGSADPAIGVYGEDSKEISFRGPVTVDMRSKIRGNFPVARDGHGVWFGLKPGREEPWLFDISKLSFTSVLDRPAEFIDPETSTLKVDDWADNLYPTLNGQTLPLQIDEASYSLAIAPDAQSFMLGTGFGLYRFDAKGTQIWRKRPEGETWGVNLSADGAIVIAAIGDGTIRWYRASDGAELLAFFVHAPDQRWIAWTPSGYYAASAGGEDLIGWHVNGKSWDAPVDFFPASLFHNRFYRPDIVQMVLKTKDEARAVQQANLIAKRKAEEEGIEKNLPPVVEITADPRGVETDRPELVLKYRLRSPTGQPLSRLEVRIDGRPADSKGMEVIDETLALDTENSMIVRVPPQDSQVSLIAFIGDQPSAAASVSVKWTGAKPEEKPKPKLTALLIGVTGYSVPNMAPLAFADDDAVDLDRLLKDQKGRIFSDVETRVLVNSEATKDNILDGLTWLDQNTDKGDYALLFVSGHGVTDLRQKFYFLPIDANIAPEKLRTTAVTESEIKDVLSSIRGNVVFFVDACRSGASLDGLTRADATSLVNGLSRDDAGIVMFASSSSDEDSLESPDWNNGAFTEALLAGLKGKANYVPDGAVDTAELQLFLPKDVKQLTEGRQTAIYRKPDLNEDFALTAAP